MSTFIDQTFEKVADYVPPESQLLSLLSKFGLRTSTTYSGELFTRKTNLGAKGAQGKSTL
jgi:hypothetical protein